jgi:phosphoribosylformylglycinamidine synthase
MTAVFEAHVYVTLKRGVLDPQGDTVRGGLEALGFDGVRDVRIGKFMVLTVEAPSQAAAEARVHDMCHQLLANPVIEEHRFDLREVPQAAAAGKS